MKTVLAFLSHGPTVAMAQSLDHDWTCHLNHDVISFRIINYFIDNLSKASVHCNHGVTGGSTAPRGQTGLRAFPSGYNITRRDGNWSISNGNVACYIIYIIIIIRIKSTHHSRRNRIK